MNPLRVLIRRFDGWLSRVEGVEPFTDDPRCILRIQTDHAAHELVLPDGTIPRGAKVLLIHAWNGRMPVIPAEGPTLEYASRLQRMAIYSFCLIAQKIKEDGGLHDAQAVGGFTAHLSIEEAKGGRAAFEHLGFTILPYHRPLGAFGEFLENFYTWWVMWTFSPVSMRHRSLWKLQRTEFWMTREKFLKKYARSE